MHARKLTQIGNPGDVTLRELAKQGRVRLTGTGPGQPPGRTNAPR